jgi:hypothetical protein
VLRERGHIPAADDTGPGILALADRDRLRGLFIESGFAEPEIEEVGFTWRFEDADAYWDFLTGAAGGIAMVLERLGEDERERVREHVVEAVARHASAAGIEIPAACLVAAAS